MKNNKLGELDFANVSDSEMQEIKSLEDKISKACGRQIYLMALCDE